MRLGQHGGQEHHLHLPAQQILHGRAATLVGHMHGLHARDRLEQFRRQMIAGARAHAGIAQCLGVGL
ncbi:hypothetical protein SDC9_192328 [bioreactor metagenome]|uniref:Uncharacterized protein n=1 Tax=bioreactor metagenome TaxID=1076179 RepID=A0A645IBF7_9ZZZZ